MCVESHANHDQIRPKESLFFFSVIKSFIWSATSSSQRTRMTAPSGRRKKLFRAKMQTSEQNRKEEQNTKQTRERGSNNEQKERKKKKKFLMNMNEDRSQIYLSKIRNDSYSTSFFLIQYSNALLDLCVCIDS